MGPHKSQLKGLKKLVNLNAKLFSIIFEKSCRSQCQTSRKSLVYDHLPKIWKTTHQASSQFSLEKLCVELSWKISKQIKVKKMTKTNHIGWPSKMKQLV